MSGTLGFDIRRSATTVTVSVREDLDLSTVGPLEAALGEIRRGDRLVLDLRSLGFMDSTGVRLLMRLDLRAREEGWELVVARPSGVVARLLDICRLDERITIVDDPAAVA